MPKRVRDGGEKMPSALQAVSAVLGAFIGIRKTADREKDLASLKPVHVIVAGVIGAALFVIMIVILVRLITR
jgi:ABC-type Zn2+ transport system substrate-binding protein/surface adhesin